jgi:hypothetical protein
MTVISPVSRAWALWLRLNWARTALSRRLRRRPGKGAFLRLSSISFVHWGLFDRVPAGAARGRGRRLPHTYLLFQSNYNGRDDLYIEAFARVIKWQMRMLWSGAYGVPDPSPVAPFQKHIAENDLQPEHYYCAYPEASTRMVRSALELRPQLETFSRESAAFDPQRFASEYERFLTRVQTLL